MELFGVGPMELLLVGVITFILVGPDKFPELARQAGRWYRVARAFSADVMADVQGAVKEIEAEVDATTGGELRSIRDLATSSASILEEARADVEAASSSAQAAIDTPSIDTPPADATEPAPALAAEATPAPAEAIPLAEQARTTVAVPAEQPSNGAHGEPLDAAEAKRREAAAREAAARITGGGA